MPYYLAKPGDAMEHGWLKRFDARFWSVNFPRPMMASVVTTGPHSLRVDAVFYRTDDLAGLIWASEDGHDHPLLRYETARDYRACTLRFRWRSAGVKPLDAIDGPTLTIEGRDAAGAPRSWFVRLWNYAVGTPQDAVVSIEFASLGGGFALPGEADPVWAGDVDRMFVSIIAPGYTGEPGALGAAAEGWVELSEIVCDGSGSVLALGDTIVPEHGLSIATGYDDLYHLTPERVLRSTVQLGWRGAINHYVGMSHYFRLGPDGLVTSGLNVACAAWHRDFAERAEALGIGIIWSLSYELFDAHCPAAWKQRAANGDPALTGWVPPSTLLSPAKAAAMSYLQGIARAFVAIARDAGLAVRFQVGEPWWWVMPDKRICLYDDAAKAAVGGAPPVIDDVTAPMSTAQVALLDQAGALLASSTAALVAAVQEEAPGAEALLLVYLPTVLDAEAPELKRANVPPGWASPAFDVLQLEDYDWVTAGDTGVSARGVAAMEARLGYPADRQHYFAGFVLNAADKAKWRAIDAAAEAGRARGVAATFIWALPQVLRDGFVHFDLGEAPVEAFDDVLFPLALGREASVAPAFSTQVVTSAGGHEQRNSDWADARLRFDAGPGVRSEADIETLIGFFRARRGAAKAFRFRDPFDWTSAGMTDDPGVGDQLLGAGDGVQTRFELAKDYGGQRRRVTRPVAGSVRVAIDGVEGFDWSLEAGGVVAFDVAPGAGAEVTAGFRFDVPVRFAEDRLEVNRATFLAGEAVSVPLIEVRE